MPGICPIIDSFRPQAPSSIAVGGLDDNNSINRAKRGMYRSSYGPTIDGLQPGRASSIWVPAPTTARLHRRQAELLEKLTKSEDADLHQIIRENPGIDPELDAALDRPFTASSRSSP
jgi:hypothetical protein